LFDLRIKLHKSQKDVGSLAQLNSTHLNSGSIVIQNNAKCEMRNAQQIRLVYNGGNFKLKENPTRRGVSPHQFRPEKKQEHLVVSTNATQPQINLQLRVSITVSPFYSLPLLHSLSALLCAVGHTLGQVCGNLKITLN